MKAPGLLYGLRIIDLVIENNEMGFNELKQILEITPSSFKSICADTGSRRIFIEGFKPKVRNRQKANCLF